FKLAKLTPAPARKVRSPIISECIAHLECKLENTVEAGECIIFIGEVLEAYASEEFFKNGVWDVKAISLPLHLGGSWFAIPGRVVKP
ncbi:MAG: flavin reductase, partial [Thaumarchaeota archaeon]|nr:flavin reductase [Nitrososphaerota archaeon]